MKSAGPILINFMAQPLEYHISQDMKTCNSEMPF